MKKFFIDFICAFMPFLYFRFKFFKTCKNNHIEISPCDYQTVSLKIKGKNNTVIIKKRPEKAGKIKISMAADESTVVIGENVHVSSSLKILMGQNHPNFGKVSNAKCIIGDGTSFESTEIVTFNSNSSIEIGEKCMFSTGIKIWNTDAHPIFDKETGRILNKVGALKIGSHVWCGAYVSILKNTRIADDCIVGWGAVVSGKFDTPNGIIAGNPAKYVRHGITWNADGSGRYIQNQPETE